MKPKKHDFSYHLKQNFLMVSGTRLMVIVATWDCTKKHKKASTSLPRA